MRIYCAHCGEKAIITNSNNVSKKTKDLYLQCTNPECNARMLYILSHQYDITPPKKTFTTAIEEIIAALPPKDRLALAKKILPQNYC